MEEKINIAGKKETREEEKTAGAEKEKQGKAEEKEESRKKEEARVNGKDLGISTKHAIFICRFIKGKKIDEAIRLLELVIKKKIAVPMSGEIPHRKGQGIMSGRYPVKASKMFIMLLKSLNANCNHLGIENPCIAETIPNKASMPRRRWGSMRFKRTHVTLTAKEKKEESKEKK